MRSKIRGAASLVSMSMWMACAGAPGSTLEEEDTNPQSGAARDSGNPGEEGATFNPGDGGSIPNGNDGALGVDGAPNTLSDGAVVPAGGDAVLVGAGDIGDCSGGADRTGKLLDLIPGTVFTLGDNAYKDGTDADFLKCYEPFWGKHKSRTRPAIGNHEYHTKGAAGHFKYYGASAGDPAKGYYSYDAGSWHVIVLNSNCGDIGGCDGNSAQMQWLVADLQANAAKKCTAAMWHHPRWNAGRHSPSTGMQPMWKTLYDNGADLVLGGHDHNYQRWKPLDANGVEDTAKGIRSIVVGTGGADFYPVGNDARIDAKESDTWGVLKLTLKTGSYDWEFVGEAGKTFVDKGSANCH